MSHYLLGISSAWDTMEDINKYMVSASYEHISNELERIVALISCSIL